MFCGIHFGHHNIFEQCRKKKLLLCVTFRIGDISDQKDFHNLQTEDSLFTSD